MGSVFRFKEFEINQRGCAMKINTDGVLLGALVEANNSKRILDIGTGTGVIAMMLAQRAPNAIVDAVEIDESAYQGASMNFQNSKFGSRLRSFLSSFESLDVTDKYDLIISNPPFYTNSLHNPDARKKLARHTDFDFFDRMLDFAAANLTQDGRLTLVLPVELADYVVNIGLKLNLNLIQSVKIKSFTDTEVIRQIVTLSLFKEQITEKEFVIYESKGVYSEEYKEVLKPFFLAF